MKLINEKYLAITGGIGGAKLALGLTHILSTDQLAFVVNTADDFQHYGLHICPDIDTLLYTLSGLANTEFGWGRGQESWHCMEVLKQLQDEPWFQLGDYDLGIHLYRTKLHQSGERLTCITKLIFERFNVPYSVFPMCDEPVSTIVKTTNGELAFQHYFVRDACEPKVLGFYFNKIQSAKPVPELYSWIHEKKPAGIIICPSNPFVSVDPILKIPGMRDLLRLHNQKVVAIAPIIGGQAVIGPLAKMMEELGRPVAPLSIAEHYGDLIDGIVIDEQDASQQAKIQSLGIEVVVAQTMMRTLQDRIDLAQTTLNFMRAIC